MGVSRSASVVMAYIMKELGYDYERSFGYVKQLRSCVNPNESVRVQLRTYESILQAHKAKYSLFEPSTMLATTMASTNSLLLPVSTNPSLGSMMTTTTTTSSGCGQNSQSAQAISNSGLSVKEAVNKIKSISAIESSNNSFWCKFTI